MNKFVSFLAILFCSFCITAAQSNCDSLKNQENFLRKNVRKDLIVFAAVSVLSGGLFVYSFHTDMKGDNKQTAAWGIEIGIPIGVLTVTVVDVIKKIQFNIENRNKCKTQ